MTHSTRLSALIRHAERIEKRLIPLRQLSQQLSLFRLGVFLAALLLTAGVFTFSTWIAGIFTAIISTAAFIYAVIIHRRLEQNIRQHEVWTTHKRTQIARMQLDWDGIPLPADTLKDFNHPFQSDLDLVGERSLQQLLDTTTTVGGSNRLRAWLTNIQNDTATIAERQQLVGELLPRTLLRDKLTVAARLAAKTTAKWNANDLLGWLKKETPIAPLRRFVWVFGVFSVVNAGLFLLNIAGILPPYWQTTYLIYLGLTYLTLNRVGKSFREASKLHDILTQLTDVFGELESYRYRHTPALKKQCTPFLDKAQRPSKVLGRIGRIVSAASFGYNPLLWFVVNIIAPWDFYFAFRLAQEKGVLREKMPAWLDTWYTVEALSALANFAYLNPSSTNFPTIAHRDPIFATTHLGHPLIPQAERISNDFTFTQIGQVGLITGSNMAGKSTFLRTLGLNFALAYAGGMVMADTFSTPIFRLFSAINVTDSVNDGISYFYAEVKRLKKLLAELDNNNSQPLFFLIDEIFRGTNNRERLIGSRAYVRALAQKNGVGFISTHDLELIQLADDVPEIQNYHFRDDFADGQMAFDYTIRSGPCPTTNALKIMALEGLPISE